MSKKNTISLVAVLLFSILLTSCITITNLIQATTAVFGESITTELEIETAFTDANPHYGIIGVMLPLDFVVDSVYMSGDYAADYFTFLHPDSADGDPGGVVEFWADSLESHFPTSADMEWRVYQR